MACSNHLMVTSFIYKAKLLKLLKIEIGMLFLFSLVHFARMKHCLCSRFRFLSRASPYVYLLEILTYCRLPQVSFVMGANVKFLSFLKRLVIL